MLHQHRLSVGVPETSTVDGNFLTPSKPGVRGMCGQDVRGSRVLKLVAPSVVGSAVESPNLRFAD